MENPRARAIRPNLEIVPAVPAANEITVSLPAWELLAVTITTGLSTSR